MFVEQAHIRLDIKRIFDKLDSERDQTNEKSTNHQGSMTSTINECDICDPRGHCVPDCVDRDHFISIKKINDESIK